MVFDDAVVDQGDARLVVAQVREMRVGIVRGRHAVGGPAGVGDAGEAADLVLGNLFGQFGHSLRAARTAQMAVGIDGDAAGIIAAVFQALEAFNKNGGDVALGDGANNAAHRKCSGKFVYRRIVLAQRRNLISLSSQLCKLIPLHKCD
ncbi:hypothetical protein D9M69_478640 [compost metagenome]